MSCLLGPPTLAGYQAFLLANGFTTTVLPPDSPVVRLSFAVAQGIVSCWLQAIDPDIYTLAVYNLATDRLVNFAQDQPGQTFFRGGPNGQPPGLYQQYNLQAVGPFGVISASADEATSQSIAVPESLQNLQLMDIANLQTPWGRTYLQFAQMLGTLWGLTG